MYGTRGQRRGTTPLARPTRPDYCSLHSPFEAISSGSFQPGKCVGGNGRSMAMPNKEPIKRVPKFSSERAEREFWRRHDSADYLDWSKAKSVRLAQLKPSTRSISIRLPESLIEDIKVLANKRDIPYQSLLKLYVAQKVDEELRSGDLRPIPASRVLRLARY